ncbi:copper resistance CopC/CopD family protein [Salinarimonas chemoclinalis]|uniref:copper resistance CopC/CopD family protein n=1 Tax=Salinarimonas chemoclinalis TaxID=3241599 RepID=UPI003558EF56
MTRHRPPSTAGGGLRPPAAPRIAALRLALLLALLVGLVSGLVGEARAHARLQAAEPARDAVLEAAPEAVRLVFNEPVAPLSVRWITPDGASREAASRVEGAVLVIEPPGDLAAGTHLVAWRVVSADGHPVGGTHVFSIGAPSAAQAPEATAGATAGAAALGRFLLTLALALGVGGAGYAVLVERGRVPRAALRVARAAALATLPAALVATLLHGADLVAAAPPALVSGRDLAAAWEAGVTSAFGRSALAAIAAGLLAALALGASRLAAYPAVGALALAGASYALFGHAATAPPRALAAAAVALHALLGLLWVGALPVLLAILVDRRAEAAAALARFSTVALVPALVLVATGAMLTVLQVAPAPEALGAGAYVPLLAAKVALVAGMLALAFVNRTRLAPALAHGRPRAHGRLRASLRAEVVLGVAALALVSSLRATPPPRAMAQAPVADARIELHLHGRLAMAQVSVIPGRAGANRFELALADADFAPLVPLEVTVALARPDIGIERVEARAVRAGEAFVVEALALPVAGSWDLRVEVLVTDFDREVLGGTLVLE